MKRLSIQLFMIGCIAVIFAACKKNKDNTAADELLPAKISRNGITLLELFYDNGKKLARINYYFNGSFDSYTLYEYDQAGIKESRRYDAGDHELEYRTVFTLDNFGRVIKGENYSSSNLAQIGSINEYAYNNLDQLTSKQFRQPGDPVFSRDTYLYDNQGNLIQHKITYYPGQPAERLSLQVDYTPGSKPMPAHWNNYLFLLSISGVGDQIRDMYNTSTHYKSWDNNEQLYSESIYEASARQENSNGYLISQILTRKKILPAGSDEAVEWTYEYTQ